MTDTVADERAAEDRETARVASIEAGMVKAGIPIDEPSPVDYFAFDQTLRVLLPDGVSWVEHKVLNEGQRRKYLNETNRNVRFKKATGDAEMNLAPGTEKAALLEVALINWNLIKDGISTPFRIDTLRNFLNVANPKIIDIIHKEIVKANSWLMAEMSLEDIDREIAALQEMRVTKVAEEEGKDVSSAR